MLRVAGEVLRKQWMLAAAVGVAILVSACGAAVGSPVSRTSSGTVTFGQLVGSPPNYIFPLVSSADSGNNNITYLEPLMWRPLYWFGHSNSPQPTINYSLSLAKAPVWSNSGRTVTITLLHYQWSNGSVLTTRDVEFWMNLLKANEVDFVGYAPGWWLDQISSVDYSSASQFSITFNAAYNRPWLIANGLSEIVPIPQYAWDRTSATGPVMNYDLTTDGAHAVYNFLNGESTTLSTWDTNPLWQVVDGPFRLERNDGFDPTTGLLIMVPNPEYSGPVKPKIARLEELPFTSSTAEIDAVLAGRVDYGYLPFTDLKLKSRLATLGYKTDPWLEWGISFAGYTFPNRSVGSVIAQLYVRQALQRLIDQPQYIKAIYHGYASATYGPVPVYPKTSYVTHLESKNPLPYDPAVAKELLTGHGWKVVPRGVSTCVDPGTGPRQCGAGIAKGLALSMTMLFPSGFPAYTAEMQAIQSSFSTAGIRLQLKSAPTQTASTEIAACNTATGAGCDYALWVLGSPEWTYVPTYYPSGDPLLVATGTTTYPGNPPFISQASKLVTLSHQPGLSGLYQYENYLAVQLPYLWLPNAAYQISLISNKLNGITAQDSTGHIYPENWSLSS